jgi:hypothetical protein
MKIPHTISSMNVKADRTASCTYELIKCINARILMRIFFFKPELNDILIDEIYK